MDFRVPFSGRAHAYTEEEIAVVVDVAQNAAPLTQGVHLARFEQRFAEYAGVEHAFAVCNATAALELSAQLCRFAPGDEVIIPSHTFTASAYPFVKHGARPVWADIDPRTRVVTAETLAARLTPRTRAIVVVHLYGYAADMPSIMSFARNHGLRVIEDVAQALGTEVGGQMAGSFGDFGVFSFHSHKNVTTLGEGGMLALRDPEFARLLPMLRHNGHCGFEAEREDYWIPAMGNVGLPRLDGVALMPSNYCLGEVECALGVLLLDRIDRINDEKRERALQVIDALADLPEMEFHRVESRRHNYHLLVASLGDGLRDPFIRTMAREHGVQCVVQYCPLDRYPFYRELGFGEAECPVADRFFDSMVSFPFHHSLGDADLQYTVECTHRTVRALHP